MDDRAEAVERALIRVLEEHSPEEFLGWGFKPDAADARDRVASHVDGGDLEGGPVDEFRFSVRTWWAVWEPRCVLARAGDDQTWETRIAREFCDDVRWPIDEDPIP